MMLGRIYLTCSLALGLCLLGACDDEDEGGYDASINPALPGGLAGTGGTAGIGGGGTTGGGTTGGGITGGATTGGGTTGGFPSGGFPSGGFPSGSPTGGGTTGGATTGGATTGGIAGLDGGIPGTDGGVRSDSGTPSPDSGTPPVSAGACTPPPSSTFQQTVWEPGGANGDYTVIRPATLGEGGFMHPPIAWGNGVITTPTLYMELLDNLAKQGFVVIGDPGIAVTAQSVREGLEWLIEQGSGSGKFAGKLALNCAGTIGYSMGGGSAVGAGAHPAVKAVVTIHGLTDAAESAKGPILITNSEQDGFVTKDGFSVPTYDRSRTQPTILASHETGDHLEPLGNGGADAEPSIAWLRYWIYGDQSQKDWFFGDNCKLCDWPDFRRKNHPEWR